MPAIPILGFLPDADPTTPGVITSCDGWIPTTKGLRSSYGLVNVGYSALPAACIGGAVARLVDDTTRVFAGTAANLYEVASGDWAERSKSADAYTSGLNRWRFAQVGNVTLATNYYDPIQLSNSSGVFSDLADSPKAKYICMTKSTAGEFVMLGATDDSGLGITGGPNSTDLNRVWWSGIGNYTTWAPSLATQAGTLQLVDAPGPITGLKALGEYIVAYKRGAIYVGTYQGSTTQWGFRQVTDEVGALSQECIIAVQAAHYFISADSIMRFTGDIPQDVGTGIKEWFFGDLDMAHADKIVSLYDRYRGLCYWFYPSTTTGGGVVDKWIALHVASGRWGAGTDTVEATMESISASTTWDGLWTDLTFNTIPDVIFDSAYFSVEKSYPTVFNTSHTMMSLSGASGTNTFTTGYVGDDIGYTMLRRLTPRWQVLPTSATCTHTHLAILGDSPVNKSPVAMTQGRFDLMHSSRWHKFTVATVGTCEFSAIVFDGVNAGQQ